MHQDFSDREYMKKSIESFLQKIQSKYDATNPDPEMFKFHYIFKINEIDLDFRVIQYKNQEYKLDVLSIVALSPEHKERYDEQKEIQNKLKNDIFMWLMPREPNYNLFFDNPESYYVVFDSIYDGDLTFAKFMQAVNRTMKSSMLCRRLIQIHLQPKQEEELK